MKITQKDREKAECLLKELTLKEKLNIIHGTGLFHTGAVERLGIPAVYMSDGPMGVRKEMKDDAWEACGNTEDYVTYLPCNSAIASTWNRELAYACGQELGEEARGRGKDVILAPGINIKRSPLGGRNFEYMSEDPYLTAQQCVPLIQGIQENDVAACVKHYALNHQEYRRLWVNVEVSERALREIYLPAFEAAVKQANVLSVMGGYNLFRGVRCCENGYLLDEILRKEWGFEGVTISDWGGILRTKESAQVGMDVEMSIYNNFDEYFFANPLEEAVERGEIAMEKVDEKVRRMLTVMSALHMLGGERKSGCYNTAAHRDVALQTARESVILLKNEEQRLPISKEKTKKLLVIGQNADRVYSNGGGSSEIKALYEISPLAGLKALLGGNTKVDYVRGYYVPELASQDEKWQESSLKETGVLGEETHKNPASGMDDGRLAMGVNGQVDLRDGQVAEPEILTEEIRQKRFELLQEAVQMAATYDEVIFVGGLDHNYDVENQDRRDMKLPYGQEEVIEAVLAANPNTVLVMMAGSPVEMGSFKDKAKAIVWQWYAGMEGGTALAEVLLGDINPSGKLPETIPFTHTDCSAHCIGTFGDKDETEYKEGIYVGYRYYDTKQVPVAFCFGHGLSYTEFAYRDIQAVPMEKDGAGVKVSCLVKNTGMRDGKEVVQLYVAAPNSAVDRPAKELKGYEKVWLQAGEEKLVEFELGKEAFSYYDENRKCFYVQPGEYQIMLGASAMDIRLVGSVKLR
ncbi:MAG: glycoside hydrolase family 3 C-terminal domain-containing protein [Lachnospiraceae bacterium]|nr:glycoside hydrolase family 3 C-terminal domain-containing protein [Lachnospiraceae bacterium]